jgi:hypothetical protein
MGKEFFNQPLIEEPTEPSDSDRIGFGQPGVQAGKNMLWSYFKQIVQAIASIFNWIDFTPQVTPPTHVIGRIFYDQTENTHTFYNDIAGISLQIGEELRARLTNDTGGTLLNGTAVAIIGAVGANLQVNLLDASDQESSIRAFGLMTHDVVNGQPGYSVRYGAVRELNTTGCPTGSIVYANPLIPGEITNIRPTAPNYPVRIGICLIEDAVNGIIAVDTLAFNGSDTSVNAEGIINGIATNAPNVEVSVSGGIIYADVTNEDFPLRNIPFLLDGKRYFLDTTTNTGPGGAARVIVPPGPDSNTLEESIVYIYINASVPTLAISTTTPSIPFVKICNLMVFDAVRTQAEGKPDGYRRSNDSINLLNGVNDGAIGLIRDIMAAIREKLGSNWIDGQDGTPTVDNSNIKLALSAGKGRQFREQSTPFFDGNLYQIYNDNTNTVTYQSSTNLTDITEDANGNSLLSNNTFYTIRLFYQLNSNGVGNNVIATRPLGFYTSAANAQADPLNYAVPMGDPIKEELIYPLYDLIIGRTGSGGVTISLVELRNRRSKLAAGGGGGGAQGATVDEKIRVSAADTTTDYLDPKFTVGDEFTKEIANPGANESLLIKFKGWVYNAARTFYGVFSMANLTANRTFTMKDESGTIPLLESNSTEFDGQAHGGYFVKSFTASAIFNANDGNNQEMEVTGDTTLSLQNELPGGFTVTLPINSLTSPVITLDSSFGSPANSNDALSGADDDINTIVVLVRPGGSKLYTITVTTP